MDTDALSFEVDPWSPADPPLSFRFDEIAERELRGLGWPDANVALSASFVLSAEAYTVSVPVIGRRRWATVGAFGVTGSGTPWFLTDQSFALYVDPREVARVAREAIRVWTELYGTLTNVVLRDNRVARRFLTHLGATFAPAYTLNGETYLAFTFFPREAPLYVGNGTR